MLRPIALILALWPASLLAAPPAHYGCSWLLSKPAEVIAAEERLLDAVDLSAIDWRAETTYLLSPPGIFKFSQADASFVLRFFSGNDDPDFEVFVARVFQAAGLRTPTVRKVPVSRVRDLWLAAQRVTPEFGRSCPLVRCSASVAVFHEGLRSFDQDADLHGLDALQWQTWPRALVTRLADRFALHLAFAIWDYHRANWLYWSVDADILDVDLAWQSRAFRWGEGALVRTGLQNPISGTDHTGQLLPRLLGRVSSGMRQWLQDLNEQALQEWAQVTQFPLSQRQARGTLQRRDLILQIIDENR